MGVILHLVAQVVEEVLAKLTLGEADGESSLGQLGEDFLEGG